MPANSDVQLQRQVLQLRYWQHLVNESMKQGAIKFTVHMAFGHEAIAAAVGAAMEAGDQLVLTHRNIAYNLARVGALKPIFDEYRQLPSGISGGRLGTMNMSCPERGVVYTSSILGNDMPVACGLALARKTLAQPGVVIVLTGDGAMEEGTFYESLVLTRSKGLRCLFVVENNKYAMASTIAERRCPIAIDKLCQSVGTPYLHLQGNRVAGYRDALKGLRQEMVEKGMPACIEVDLANLNRHAGATPGWPTDPMNIDLQRGLVVVENEYDPVYVIRQGMEPSTYAAIEESVRAERWE